MSLRRADVLTLGALGVVGLVTLLASRDYGLMINDEGWILHPVQRMLDGEILYRDLFSFYAPMRYHLFALLFSLTEPSLLLIRSVWIALLLTSAAGLFLLARRLAPLPLAWIPAGIYLLAPGPWHKAPYGLCSVAFFLILARTLTRPRSLGFAGLGAVAGLTLLTRQDLGIAQLGLALGASALGGILDASEGAPLGERLRRGLRRVWLVGCGFVATIAPLAVLYAEHGALDNLVDMVFVRAFAQMGAHPSPFATLLAPGSFAMAPEGRAVGAILLLPIVVYVAVAVTLARRLLRGRALGPEFGLVAALVLYGVATLPQAYYPALLLRFLQSAPPFYLLSVWLLSRAALALAARGGAARRAAQWVPPLTAAAGAWLVWLVIRGLPHFAPYDEYSGSLRARRYDHRIRVLDEELYVDWPRAEEIRRVRAFFAEHTAPGEPIFAAPLFSLYYTLLDRPNPTRLLAEIHAARGELDAAIEAFHAAAALDPAKPDPLERAAAVQLAQGRPAAAASDLARALTVRESPTARRLLRRIEQGTRRSTPGAGASRSSEPNE